jgi:selenide,water dikinase
VKKGMIEQMPDNQDLRKLCLTREQMFVGGGCHGKLAGALLEEVLTCSSSPERAQEEPAGLFEPEDSAFLEGISGALLFSTDMIYLPGMNLYEAGRIGALHALGDIYASGGLPRWALVTLVICRSTPLQYGEAVMAGVRDTCLQEGVAIVGGHTLTGNEAMVGLSVVGETDGPHFRKSGAQPGHRLFLSKPIGTGLCLAGFKHGHCADDALSDAIAVMLTSNRTGAGAARSCATACTDVTGFGLLGHLSEMLTHSTGVELFKHAIPTLPFAQAPPRALAESSWVKNNYEYCTSRTEVEFSGAAYELAALLDPQTNGPRLVAAPVAAIGSLVMAGYSEIGCFTDQPAIVIR